MPIEPKVVIENRVLLGLSDSRLLQPIGTVYAGTEEYRVYAPARAKGNSLQWLDCSRVHKPTDRGENVGYRYSPWIITARGVDHSDCWSRIRTPRCC